jgi:hypothetical protein
MKPTRADWDPKIFNRKCSHLAVKYFSIYFSPVSLIIDGYDFTLMKVNFETCH